MSPVNYSQHISGPATQQEPARADQIPNAGGGYTFKLDPWKRLERFLILGAEGGTYYATERKLTRENAMHVVERWKTDPYQTRNAIAHISDTGRAPKNDPSIFALALGASSDNPAARELAFLTLNQVCRTGTHLFQFIEAVDKMRGWGRGLRTGLRHWYGSKNADDLAYQVVKYQSRGGWSHRDVLRLVHPKATTPQHHAIYRWVVDREHGPGERQVVRRGMGDTPLARAVSGTIHDYPEVGRENIPELIVAYERLKRATELKDVLALVTKHRMTHEMIPAEWLSKSEVWEALFDHMPLHALVRNLGQLTSRGVLSPMGARTTVACERLNDRGQLKKARMHPIALLNALRTYERGRGTKGKLTWSPVPMINQALEAAFYTAFDTIEPTGKPTMVALDVSYSMESGTCLGLDLTPREASACLAMVTMRTEPVWHCVGYSDVCKTLDLHPGMRLRDVVEYVSRLSFSSTNCALPIAFAAKYAPATQVFVSITDNEQNSYDIHPHVALAAYRKNYQPKAKMAVVAMTATGNTIADPNDAGQMDFAGFDAAGPQVLADFARE